MKMSPPRALHIVLHFLHVLATTSAGHAVDFELPPLLTRDLAGQEDAVSCMHGTTETHFGHSFPLWSSSWSGA